MMISNQSHSVIESHPTTFPVSTSYESVGSATTAPNAEPYHKHKAHMRSISRFARVIERPNVEIDASDEHKIAFVQWLSIEFPEESKSLRSCLSLDYDSICEWLEEWQEKLQSLAWFLEGKTKCPDGIFAENITATVPCERIWIWSDCFLVFSGRYSILFIFDGGRSDLQCVKTINFPLSSQNVANLSSEIGLDLRGCAQHDVSGSLAGGRYLATLKSIHGSELAPDSPARHTLWDSFESQSEGTKELESSARGLQELQIPAANPSGPMRSTWHIGSRPHVASRDYSGSGSQANASTSASGAPNDLYRGAGQPGRDRITWLVPSASLIAETTTTPTLPSLPDGYDRRPNSLTYCNSRVFKPPQIRSDGSNEAEIAFLAKWLNLRFPEERKKLAPCLSLRYQSTWHGWVSEWQEKLQAGLRILPYLAAANAVESPHGIVVEKISARTPCGRIWIWGDSFLVWVGTSSKIKLLIFDEGHWRLRMGKNNCPAARRPRLDKRH